MPHIHQTNDGNRETFQMSLHCKLIYRPEMSTTGKYLASHRFDILQRSCVAPHDSTLHLELEDCGVNENMSDSEHAFNTVDKSIFNPG